MVRSRLMIEADIRRRREARRDQAEMVMLGMVLRGEDFVLSCESEAAAKYWVKRLDSLLRSREFRVTEG